MSSFSTKRITLKHLTLDELERCSEAETDVDLIRWAREHNISLLSLELHSLIDQEKRIRLLETSVGMQSTGPVKTLSEIGSTLQNGANVTIQKQEDDWYLLTNELGDIANFKTGSELT